MGVANSKHTSLKTTNPHPSHPALPPPPPPPPPSTQTTMQIPTADRFPKELQTTISLTRDVTRTKTKLYAKYITHVLPLGMFILFGVISLFLEEAAGRWK